MGFQQKIFALLVIGLCTLCITKKSAAQLSAAQNYARNRPGVVMVKTNFTADVYLSQVVLDRKLFNALIDSIHQLEASGSRLIAEDKLDIVLKEFNNRPNDFFKKTADYRRYTRTISTTGTGFFITEDGFLVTNCHVVDEVDSYIRRKFVLSSFREVTASNIAALERAWGVAFNESQREVLYHTLSKVYSEIRSVLLENLQKNIYVIYSIDTAGKNPPSRTAIASLVIKGHSMPGKDIAVLKIKSPNPLPALKISELGLPRTGDRVFVYGYPDPVTKNEYLSSETTLEPSLTTGIVSGIRKTVGKWDVVQMDANINHGNSGGPVCNDAGEVMGIATFGSLESNTGILAPGLNFSIPVLELNDFLDSLKIIAKPGKTSALFNSAMDDYDQEEYRASLRKLKRLKKQNALFPGLSGYINDCNEKIGLGLDRTEHLIKLWLMAGGLLMVTFFIYWLWKKYYKRNTLQKQTLQDAVTLPE